MKQVLLKGFLYLLVSVCACIAQSRHVTDSVNVNICWNGSPDTSAVYLLFYRNYTGDTTWNALGSTKLTSFTLTKTSKKIVIFGVRTVLYNDTSDFHTSLDSTACNSTVSCSSCSQSGAWYLQWKVKKPNNLTDKR